MELLRSVFPEDPDEDEVNRVMFLYVVTLLVVAGVVYVSWSASPVQRIQAWWNRFTTGIFAAIPTHAQTPDSAPSRPIVRDNQANNQTLASSYVKRDGIGADLSPNDFTIPFHEYTEQDIADMKAAWRKCLNGRATDAAACRDRTEQLLAEARNARQADRNHVAAEAKNTDAQAKRADAAETRAEKAEADLLAYKRRFVAPPVFAHDPEDQKMIQQLHQEKMTLQQQLDSCLEAKSRSIGPKEIKEYEKKLEKAQSEVREAQKAVLKEQKANKGGVVDKNGKTLADRAQAEIEAQKRRIKTQIAIIQGQKAEIAGHKADLATQYSIVDKQAEALKQYATTVAVQKDTIELNQARLKQYHTDIQEFKDSENAYKVAIADLRQSRAVVEQELAECQKEKTLLEVKFDALLEESREHEARLEDSFKFRNQTTSRNIKLQADIVSRDTTIDNLNKLLKTGKEESDCARCKTMQEQMVLLQNSQKSQQASSAVIMKQYTDMETELKECKDLLANSMTEKAKAYIKVAQEQTKAVRAERDSLQKTSNSKDKEIKKLTEELVALKLQKTVDVGFAERCNKLQAEAGDLKAATAASRCENCQELQNVVDRQKDYLANSTPQKRVLQLIDRDTKIKALQEDITAAKVKTGAANIDECKDLKKKVKALEETIENQEFDLVNYPADIEQLKIWLEEVRVALCSMLNLPSGEARIPANEESEANELAEMLRGVKEKCIRAEEREAEVKDLREQLQESNLDHLEDEIEHLKQCLAKAEADLTREEEKDGPFKPDPKLKQIVLLKQRVAQLERQLEDGEAPLSASEDLVRIKELEDQLEATRNELTECHKHRDEMDDRIVELEEEVQEAVNVNDPDGYTQKLKATNAELNSTHAKLQACEAELARAKEQLGSPGAFTKELNAAKMEIESSKAKLEACEARPAELTATIAGLEAELEKQRNNAKSGGSYANDDAAAQQKIQSLVSELDNATVALSNSKTEAEQAKNETEQLRAEAIEKFKEAELKIESLQEAAHASSNQEGEISRLRTVNDDLIAAQKNLEAELADLKPKLVDSNKHWDHFGAIAIQSKTEISNLHELLKTEREQIKALSVVGFSKDTEIKRMKELLANANRAEQAALANLHGEGSAMINDLQQQLNTALEKCATAVSAHASLQLRLTDLERERDAAVQALFSDPDNNTSAVELSNLRHQRTELQQRLHDNNNHFTRQVQELTDSNNRREQVIQGLKSKYEGYGTRQAGIVPQQKYDEIGRENILIRQELGRLQDWKLKMQGPSATVSSDELKREQLRRVGAETKVNNLTKETADLKRKLRDSEDSHKDKQMGGTPSGNAYGGALSMAMKENGRIRGEAQRARDSYAIQLQDVLNERNKYLAQIQDLQRSAGQNQSADLTDSLRQANERIAELKKWQDDFQADVAEAEAKRALEDIATQMAKARQQAAESGFGSRGTTRKKGASELESPPQKDSKLRRGEEEDDELFGEPMGP